MADSLFCIASNGLATKPHCQCDLPHLSLLGIVCLLFMIKVDIGHGMVAHSPWVPPYSTLFLISKLGIMIVQLIDLSAVIDTTCVTIDRKRRVFGHVSSPLLVPWCVILYVRRTSSIYFTSCPFDACKLATSVGSLNSLSLAPNDVKCRVHKTMLLLISRLDSTNNNAPIIQDGDKILQSSPWHCIESLLLGWFFQSLHDMATHETSSCLSHQQTCYKVFIREMNVWKITTVLGISFVKMESTCCMISLLKLMKGEKHFAIVQAIEMD